MLGGKPDLSGGVLLSIQQCALNIIELPENGPVTPRFV
mgnify:CR=1 FL=1